MAIADPPAETIAAPSLDALAAAINDDHDAVEHMARSTLDRARAAGDKLIQAKAQVEHGQWLPWLAANCPRLATRTAQAYMKLAREWEVLTLKYAESAHLTLDSALKLLAAPTAPAELEPLTPEEEAERERLEQNVFRAFEGQERAVNALRERLAEARNLLAAHPGAFWDWCEKELKLDAEMLVYIENPPRPWSRPNDAMLCAEIRWVLRYRDGLSDAEARAQMAQWDAEQGMAA